MNFRYLPALGLLILWCLSACDTPGGGSATTHNSDPNETATSGRAVIAVDESFEPIMETMIEVFESSYPDAEIVPVYLPGEAAIQSMLATDSFRMAISTRSLSNSEQNSLKEQQTSAKISKVAKDAIAFIIHKDNLDSTLSSAQLSGVLTGEITSWKQINEKSSLEDILLVFDNEASSTTTFLKDSILGGQNINPKAFAANTYPEILDYVAKTPGALGVIGVAYVSDHDDKRWTGFTESIRVVGLETRQPCAFVDVPFMQPYQGYMAEDCYPLTRPVFCLLREPRVGLGTGFVSFIASDQGQRIFLKAGLVPEFAVPRVVKMPK